MRVSEIFCALAAVIIVLIQGAMAGAGRFPHTDFPFSFSEIHLTIVFIGAFVNACIAVPPGQDRKSVFDVTFTAGGKTSSCMSVQGTHFKTMTVTGPGITCTGLGYVEEKTRKRCFFRSGKWDLSYNDTLGLSGGKTGTVWSVGSGVVGNQVSLSGYSPRTRICRNSTAVCDAGPYGPVVEWKRKTQGPIFVSLIVVSYILVVTRACLVETD